MSKVRNTVESRDMLSAGEKVLCGLSGGADSVCLVLVLKGLGYEVSALHVNHCLRGAESDRDENFCRSLCEARGIPLYVRRADVKGYCAEKGLSTEEGAREIRYRAFEEQADALGIKKIATAHNLCDNSETVLFNMARGTGLKGLSGIPYKRGRIIRPLLDISRKEIENYLAEQGQDYVTDSTNLEDDCSRNIIRLNVIPELLRINPGLHRALHRLSVQAEEDEGELEAFSEVSDEGAAELSPPLRKRYIMRKLRERGITVNADRLEALDGLFEESRGSVKKYGLTGDIYAVFKNGIMSVEEIKEEDTTPVCVKIDLSREGRLELPEFDKTVTVSSVRSDIFKNNSNVQKKLTYSLVNCGKIQGVAYIRNKRDGDRIEFMGRDFHTRLKKYYNSIGLSCRERRTALVIEDEGGIIWSEYGGVCGRVSVHETENNEDIRCISVEYTAQEDTRRRKKEGPCR